MIVKGMSKQQTKTGTRDYVTAVTLLFSDAHYKFYIKIENNALYNLESITLFCINVIKVLKEL